MKKQFAAAGSASPADRIKPAATTLIRPLVGTYIAALAVVGLLLLLVPLPKPLFPEPTGQIILDKSGKILRVFLDEEQQYHLPFLDLELSAKLKSAVIRYEDRRFYRHAGIDPLALVRAMYDNLRSGKRISGASTITMQVARLAGGRPRTPANKFVEMLQALKLEILFTKAELLDLYMDRAPFGGNIVGFQAASHRYFAKDPALLTWAEAATLAVLPNAPGLIDPHRNREDLIQKRNRLLHLLFKAHRLDDETLQRSLLEPLPGNPFPFPFVAPHLSEHLHATRPPGMVRTTIDLGLQQLVKEIVGYRMDSVSRFGVHNAAVLVAETDSGKVRAYVGSSDYYDPNHNGQVDGVQANRSTGSLLKPFLYALAMDEGLLLPQTQIQDIPTHFGAFSPHNIDLVYRGLIPASESLILSLNVPTVRLLSEYGLTRFYSFLDTAGLEGLFRPPQDYGLTLILGGAEASLFELAGLYRGLGRYGIFAPLSLTPDMSASNGVRLISPGASYLTLQVLAELGRPGAEYYWENFQSGRPLSWKTGTSYGQKDAWSIGLNAQWIVAVWVGNFTGEGNANLRSSTLAAPLLFDVLNTLPEGGRREHFQPPAEALQPVKVCRDTGYRAGPDCRDVHIASAPAGGRALVQCPYHKKIYTSLDGYRVNALCWEPGQVREETRLIYPPAVTQYLRQRGRMIERLPPFKPGFAGTDSLAAVRIVYPEEGSKLWIPKDIDGNRQKLTLRAAHLEPNSILYWYADDLYLGMTTEQHTWSINFPRGSHKLEIVDSGGNRATTNFFVVSR